MSTGGHEVVVVATKLSWWPRSCRGGLSCREVVVVATKLLWWLKVVVAMQEHTKVVVVSQKHTKLSQQTAAHEVAVEATSDSLGLALAFGFGIWL